MIRAGSSRRAPMRRRRSARYRSGSPTRPGIDRPRRNASPAEIGNGSATSTPTKKTPPAIRATDKGGSRGAPVPGASVKRAGALVAGAAADVGERHPHVLGLPAGQIAEGDAVAEHAEAGAAPVLHPQAGRTAAAGAEHRGHAPLPGDDVEDAGADLDDLAGELVAADHPGLDA